MPFYRRRKYGVRRRFGRKLRRYGARKRFARRRMRKSSNHGILVRRKFRLSQITQEFGTVDEFGVVKFKLSDMPGYTEFTALYEEYKISFVKYTIENLFRNGIGQLQTIESTGGGTITDNLSATALYTYTNTTTPGDRSNLVANIHSVIDYDDAQTPTTENQLIEYRTYKVTQHKAFHQRKLRPRFYTPYTTTSSVGTLTGRGTTGWLRTSTPDVEHFGVKYMIESNGCNAEQGYDQWVEMWVRFKHMK